MAKSSNRAITRTPLDMSATQDNFFSDVALIGIVSALPSYHFCWLLNKYFEIDFRRDPDQNIPMQKKDNQYHFPIYQHMFPNSCHKYLLYKLKSGNETLLPETRQLDYLWYIQTANPEEDALLLTNDLKNIGAIQLAQIIEPDQLRSLSNLLV